MIWTKKPVAKTLGSLQDQVTALNSKITNIEKNNIGTVVDLTNYSYESRYTAPNDGYVETIVQYNASSEANLQGVIMSASNSNFLTIFMTADGTNKSQITFVKKGMTLYGSTQGTGCFVRYHPLT